MNRKDFLRKAAILGIGTAISSELTFGQTKKIENSIMPLKKVITIEEHFVLPSVSQKAQAFYAKQNDGIVAVNKVQKELMTLVLPTNENIEDVGERRLQFMNESGITMQVLSYGAGSPQNISDIPLSIELCKEANNELAKLIKLNPDRFAGFAVLPVIDPFAAATELARAVIELGLKGAMLSGTLNGRFFDENEFFPIFNKAQELNLPIYIHPAIIQKNIADYYYQSNNWSPVASAMFASAGYGWHIDSGIAIIRFIASGIFDKLPNLQLISGHWGEMVPFYLNRLDDQLGKTLKLERKISDYYKSNIYITPSGLFSEAQLQYAISEIGEDRIIYSCDYPFLIDKTAREFIEKAPFSTKIKEKIAYKNAERLLKL